MSHALHHAEEIAWRWQAFRNLASQFGKIVPARFIQRTSETTPDIPRIHNLIEGIFKPKDSEYAFSIASMLKNPYADRLEYKDDRSWYFHYSPKAGALDAAVNRSLFNCLRDEEPVIVVKQITDKHAPQGTTYKILGLGLIEDFDAQNRLFRIREMTIEGIQSRLDPDEVLSDDLVETALQLEALESWSPFVAEDRAVYKVSTRRRDRAFRRIVLDNYNQTCAVFRAKFRYQKHVEADAAHIIGKDRNGTDDPRNGIALSKTAHWAFDQGIFTLTDQYEIEVHKDAFDADVALFPLLGLDRRRILLPCDEATLPHPEAIEWHRSEVFGRFAR